MDWVAALLKHIEASRTVVFALFATSAVLFFGGRIFPQTFDPLPKEWSPFVLAALVFSTTLLVVWVASGTYRAARRRWTAAVALMASRTFTPLEQNFLLAMGANPRESMNLEHVDYAGLGVTQLEVLQMTERLAGRGVVSINPYSRELVSLTPVGRERALELQRQHPDVT